MFEAAHASTPDVAPLTTLESMMGTVVPEKQNFPTPFVPANALVDMVAKLSALDRTIKEMEGDETTVSALQARRQRLEFEINAFLDAEKDKYDPKPREKKDTPEYLFAGGVPRNTDHSVAPRSYLPPVKTQKMMNSSSLDVPMPPIDKEMSQPTSSSGLAEHAPVSPGLVLPASSSGAAAQNRYRPEESKWCRKRRWDYSPDDSEKEKDDSDVESRDQAQGTKPGGGADAGSSDLIRCSNGNAEARVPSSRASTNVNTQIFEGSPGPQGPARLQKRTQTHLARLHSGTQMFSTRGPVFVYCDYTQSGAQSAQPPHPGAFAPNVSPAHSTASAHNLRFLFCWGGSLLISSFGVLETKSFVRGPKITPPGTAGRVLDLM